MRLRRTWLCWVGLAVLGLAFPVLAQTQPPLFLRGSALGLVPPAGMKAANSFSGYEDPARGASILVHDLPLHAYSEGLGILTLLQGMAIEPRDRVREWPVAGGENGQFLKGSRTVAGQAVQTSVVLAKGPNSAALVIASVPRAAALTDEEIENALATVSVRVRPGIEEQLAALPFTIHDLAGFRAVITWRGTSLRLTDGPLETAPDLAQPLIAISSGTGFVAPPVDFDADAVRSFATIPDLERTIVDTIETEAGTDPAVVVFGHAIHRPSGRAVYATYIMRLASSGATRVSLYATCRVDEEQHYKERFARLSRSILSK